MNRVHGGDWAAFQGQYGVSPLDFSANVSPLGVPEGVRRAICDAAGEADRYPDPACTALRRAIAAHEGVRAEQVLCGNGASDLIYRALYALRPGKALVTAPAFGEYEAALTAAGSRIMRFPLDASFQMTDRVILEIDHNVDIVILCQPNNPSGVPVEPELLRRIALRCAETGAYLMVDECFADFMEEPERYRISSVCSAPVRGGALPAMCGSGQEGPEGADGGRTAALLEQFPRFLILRAFTKLYGLAGIRLGYLLCGDRMLLDNMTRCGPPWAVSCVAQSAGVAALSEIHYVNRVRRLVSEQRRWLYHQLGDLGLSVVPGMANFLLFQSPVPLDAALRRRGILIRCCGDYAGLDESWYRTAVRTHEENQRLIAALREVLE